MKRGTAVADADDDRVGKGELQRVSIVKADKAGPVETSAPRSVFDVAKAGDPKEKTEPKAKTERAVIDPDRVVIRTGVPLPEVRPGAAAMYSRLWDRMPPGAMVELPERQAHGLMAHVKKVGGKAAVRKLGEGVKGVWRLA